MKGLCLILVFLSIGQSACFSSSQATQTSSAPVAEIPQNQNLTDLAKEEAAAQKLLESGIAFKFTVNVDGVIKDGGTFTAHGYQSSDEVPIDTNVGFHNNAQNARKSFDESLSNVEEIVKKEQILDDQGIVIGERIIGISKKPKFAGEKTSFIVGKWKNNHCRFYYSPSLPHLLAFEKWRDQE